MEIGQVTRANVSGYDLGRVHRSRLYATAKRPLSANFNGALPEGVTIESTLWQTWNTPQVIMSGGEYSENLRETSITIKAQIPGSAIVKCTAYASNGGEYIQQFRIDVLMAPIYSNSSWVTGPSELTVIAQ